MANTVVPYSKVSDVEVDIKQINPQAIVGLGNLLILNPVEKATVQPAADGSSGTGTPYPDTLSTDDTLNGILLRKTDTATGALYREYKSIDAVLKDYKDDSAVAKKATAYFAQSNHSDRVAVLDYVKAQAYESLKAFWYFNWTFAVTTAVGISDDTLSLSNIFEVNRDHFLVVEDNTINNFKQLMGQNYTIGLKHDTDEAMDAALVGAVATLEVGSVTWKFKKLAGITAETLTATELSAINQVHAIAYNSISGAGDETTEGWAMSGEYIDTLHGTLWVKNQLQGKLQKLLQDNAKISYETNGINMILATVTQVLQTAYEQGIVASNANGKGDYSVTAAARDTQTKADLSARKYEGITFTYHASSAIHTVVVHGSVNSDTILANK